MVNISCVLLGLKDPYASVYFGHAMNKVAQYATIKEKFCMEMKEVSLKDA